MTDKFTLYVPDDEEGLSNWIERMSNVFGSESAVLKQSVKFLKDRKGDELESLIEDVNSDMLT